MTAPDDRRRLPRSFADFPAGILRITRDGVVVDSNGRIDAEVGLALAGRDFAEAVDRESSGAKWERMMDAARATEQGVSAELILANAGELLDPRPFSLLREPDDDTLWLIEHPRDPRLAQLRDQVTGVNSELATTQRELVREQRRLQHALAEQERLGRALEARKQELERSNRALDEFAHAVSHDLKAPLRAVGNYGTWIRQDLGEAASPELRDHAGALETQVRRMRTLIDGALAYARAGRTAAEDETIDLGALAREIVSLIDPPATARVTVASDMPTIHSPRAPLQQVLQNLIDNAVKHADGGPVHVRVEAADAGDFVELRVTDDGPGIGAGFHERIWGLFQTVRGSADSAASTGIGLALVRRLAEAQGGRAWVESTEGAGASFRVLWRRQPGGEVNG